MSETLTVGKEYDALYLPYGYEDLIAEPFKIRILITNVDEKGNYRWETVGKYDELLELPDFPKGTATGKVGPDFGGINFKEGILRIE